jgi:hypothetical protein
VCARGSDLAPLGGPSTHPLDLAWTAPAFCPGAAPSAERLRFNLCETGSDSAVPRITAVPAAQISGRHSLPKRYGVYPLPWLP